MEQSVVEWFANRIKSDKIFNFENVLNQAKEMEKEKLKDAYDAGVWDVGCRAVNFDEYYKRTFKSE